MLTIFLLFYALSKCARVFAQNESLVLVQDIRLKQIHCVTSEVDRAVVWNTPLDVKFLNATRVTFPNKTYQAIDWNRENSIKTSFGVVLDSRWENFPMVVSSSPTYGNLKFSLLKKINEFNTFEIPISARIGQEAHLYICETDEQPFLNNCYWFILGGWGGTESAMRKCKVKEIKPDSVAPSGNCSKDVDKAYKNPLRSDQFVHFTIKFNHNTKTISLVLNGEENAFLSYLDEDYSEDQIYSSVWVNSRRSAVGFWRIHDYDFYIMRPFKNFNNVLTTQKTPSVCISMYVAVCPDCSFALKLKGYYSHKVVKTKEYSFNKNSIWQKVFISYEGDKKYYTFEVSVSNSNKNTAYMAIDKISLTTVCPENEIKYSTLMTGLEKVSCEFLTGGGEIEPQPLTDATKLDLKCPLDTFGPDCFSCSLLENRCSYSKVCQYQDRNEVCYCSAGFMNEKCDTECPSGTFGLYCTQQCGYCLKSTCSSVDGYCPGNCTANFEGVYCNETINPVLKNAPKLLGECFTACKFSIDSDYRGKYPPTYYRIYFQLNNGEWFQSGDDVNISQKEFTMSNLQILNQYRVKVALCTTDHNCYTDVIPTLNFTTSCKELQEGDVVLNVSSYSVKLTISTNRMNNENCPLNTYRLKITEGTSVIYDNSLTNTNLISNVLPYHHYEYVINDTHTGTSFAGMFTTQQSAPSEVTEVGFNGTSDELHVFWAAPININGEFSGYNVQLEHTSYIACNTMRKDRQLKYEVNVTDPRIIFKSLHPYSTYLVVISAMNEFIGNPYKLAANTNESDDFIQEAYTVSIKPETVNVLIELTFNCTLVYTQFVARVELNCSAEYCTDPISRWMNKTSSPLRIHSLAPYTDYSLYTQIVTKFQKDDQLEEVNFKTKPDVPNAPRSLEIYAMERSSMYFRFLPPYPPTGIIEKYWVKIFKYRQYNSNLLIYDAAYKPKQCEIWRWMLCGSITQLDYGSYYYIDISAKNKDVSSLSQPASLQTFLKTSDPEPPLNVQGAWDDFYNLTISWQHPNKSNGLLTTFNIYVINGDIQFPHIYQIERLNLTYYYTFTNSPNIKDVVTTININSENQDKKSSSFVTYVINNPPPMPEFNVSPKITEQSNQTVTIQIPQVVNQTGISYLYVIVTKEKEGDDPRVSEKQLDLIEKWIVDLPTDRSAWIAKEYKLNPQMNGLVIVVGNGERMFFNRTNEAITNFDLQSDTSFRIYFVALNERASFERRSVYSILAKTSAEDVIPVESYNSLIYISFLVVIVPIVLLVIYAKKRKIRFTSISSGRTSSRRTDITNVQIPDTIPLTNTSDTSDTSSRSTVEEHKVPSKYSKVVNLSDFEEYIKESIFNDELARQHALFAKGEQKPNDYGKLAQNKSKNRYVNLVSYNHSRVKLKKLPDDEYSDYINANYIKGLNCPKAYIATQGPKPNTVNDFWRMIWEENVANIVMLANVFENGKKKTEKYWPNYNEDIDFADINVRHISTETFADYEIRNFIIKYDNEERKIEQLHFTTWPDHGVPLYPQSLVPFLRRILTFPHGSKPIVIHCSAGVGRTGTIILIDLALRMAAQLGYVDVLHHLYQLREQRTNMVDNIEQYKLAHLVILECLFSPDTAIRCNEHFEEAMKKVIEKELHKQMEYIERSAWQEDAISMTGEIRRKDYPEKDRFPGVPVENYGILYLPPYPPSDESSTYINASAVDGFRSRKRFIATQNPLPNTLGDFWRLAVDNDVSIVVSLQEIDLDDPSCCQFLPSKKLKVVTATAIITVHHIQTENLETHEVVSVSLHYKEEQRKIKIIVLKGWKFGEQCASNKNALLAAWQQMNQLSWNENRVLVTCRDGFTACGLYLAMCFTLEKIKLEQICDICHAVRVIRRSRRQFVQSEEQFIALYEIVYLYLSDFELYANFGSRQ